MAPDEGRPHERYELESPPEFGDDGAVANIVVDKQGALRADAAGATMLAGGPGRYRAHRAGALVVMTLDEGTGAVAREGETLALCGDIAAMPLLGLMNMLGQSRESGRLVLKRGPSERVVLLHNGDVASIGSNLPADRLGVFLVKLGKISESALEEAQRDSAATGKRIGQVLLQRGFIDSHQLWRAIQEQITELFADVVQWQEGSFVLYRLPPGFQMPPTPPLPMQGLLLEAVRRADEMSVYRERIPSMSARLRRTQRPPPAGFGEDPDDALAARVYAVIAPEAAVSDVARALHIADFDATRGCYELLKRGLVELVKAHVDTHYALRREDAHRLEVFNVAFREIHDEVVRAGQLEAFRAGVAKYLADPAHGFHAFFAGAVLDDSGALVPTPLAHNLGGLVAEGHDASTVITEALTELTFFMLFQCSSFLEPSIDEQLGRRVRLIHASLR